MIPLNTVNELFSARGTTDYTLNSVTNSGIDPLNPSKAPTKTIVDHDLLAFTSEVRSKRKFFAITKEDDLMLWVDPTDLTVEPSQNDLVTHSSEGVFHIINKRRFQDQGQTYLYVLQLRR